MIDFNIKRSDQNTISLTRLEDERDFAEDGSRADHYD